MVDPDRYAMYERAHLAVTAWIAEHTGLTRAQVARVLDMELDFWLTHPNWGEAIIRDVDERRAAEEAEGPEAGGQG